MSTRRDAVARDFAAMAALGFTVARWFVFCDGRAGIVWDEVGLPSGLDAHVFHDLDAGLEVARDAGLRLDLVLLDHHWMFAGLMQPVADPSTGVLYDARLPEGRAGVLLTRRGQDALFQHVVEPLVHRYGPSGPRPDLGAAILAYELMNEPDFVIAEWERDLSSRVPRPLPFATVADLVTRLSDLVHRAHPGALTTLGCAKAHNLWAWDDDGLGLDLLQVHTYPDVRHDDPADDLFGVPASSLDVRRPVILGEFPGGKVAPLRSPQSPRTVEDYLEFALDGGYAGAWPWSFSGTDRYGRLSADLVARFASRHPDLVNPRAAR